jgi:hypothetical protein
VPVSPPGDHSGNCRQHPHPLFQHRFDHNVSGKSQVRERWKTSRNFAFRVAI